MYESIDKAVLESAKEQFNLRETITFQDMKNRFSTQIERNQIDELIFEAYKYGVELALNVKNGTDHKNNIQPKCGEGCYYCCVFPIQVLPVETKIIINFINNNFDDEKRRQIKRNLKETQKLIRNTVKAKKHTNKYRQEYIEARIECPFLDNVTKACSIYSARPLSCLNYFEYKSSDYCKENPVTKTSVNFEDVKFTVVFTIKKALQAYEDFHGISPGTITGRYFNQNNLEILPFAFHSNDIR